MVWRYCKFWVFFIFINVRDNKCRASILSGPKVPCASGTRLLGAVAEKLKTLNTDKRTNYSQLFTRSNGTQYITQHIHIHIPSSFAHSTNCANVITPSLPPFLAAISFAMLTHDRLETFNFRKTIAKLLRLNTLDRSIGAKR